MRCCFHFLFACSCFLPRRVHHVLCVRSLTVGRVGSGSGPSIRESFGLLQLPEDALSSSAQVKEAYLRLAKLYHPDSGAATADAALFARVEEAYRVVLAHQSRVTNSDGERKEEEEEEEEMRRRLALQHRHYLSYDGVGSGTPSQRERQYQQIRVDRASEAVLSYQQREQEKAAAAEGALVERDVYKRSRNVKVTQAVERLVEDLIQESMARGHFRNLSGAGKPLLKFQHNPYADPMTHNINRILLDNGYQPPWVATQRHIREAAAHVRHILLEGRVRLTDPASPPELHQWERLCASVQEDLTKLNKMVDDYNLMVPAMRMQIVHFSLKREAELAERNAPQYREEERRRRKEEKKNANVASIGIARSRKVGLASRMWNFLHRKLTRTL
ncbi:dnaJ homolog subfamily C member 28 [Gouania willdenowi]|uniref:J domain-containing protein n=1 Tax=Gouania willdenowi TaxID=441366 RepID=A0A8C5DCK5_GOUWI|nr:dnaJ homolog subfamily C member 28 [Gouania willdenowi]